MMLRIAPSTQPTFSSHLRLQLSLDSVLPKERETLVDLDGL